MPKTGGTGLSAALTGLYPTSAALSEGGFVSNAFVREHARRPDADVFLYGHPVDNVVEALPASARIITMLRDPRDQTVSYYLQILQDDKSPVREAARALGFNEFIRRHWTYAMSQTVTLAVAISPKNDPILPTIERRAWQVRAFLDAVLFVGVLDRAAESHALLSRVLRLETPLAPPTLNTAAERGASHTEIDALRARYDELRDDPATSYLIALEYETYRKAAAILDKRLRERPRNGAFGAKAGSDLGVSSDLSPSSHR